MTTRLRAEAASLVREIQDHGLAPREIANRTRIDAGVIIALRGRRRVMMTDADVQKLRALRADLQPKPRPAATPTPETHMPVTAPTLPAPATAPAPPSSTNGRSVGEEVRDLLELLTASGWNRRRVATHLGYSHVTALANLIARGAVPTAVMIGLRTLAEAVVNGTDLPDPLPRRVRGTSGKPAAVAPAPAATPVPTPPPAPAPAPPAHRPASERPLTLLDAAADARAALDRYLGALRVMDKIRHPLMGDGLARLISEAEAQRRYLEF